MTRWILVCFAMLSLLMVVASPAAAKPGDHGGPGNRGAAQLCQKGSWEIRARVEDPDTAFVSEEECVSYAAQGGKIVDRVLHPAINVTLTPAGPSNCGIQVNLVDFVANTTYAVDVGLADGSTGPAGLDGLQCVYDDRFARGGHGLSDRFLPCRVLLGAGHLEWDRYPVDSDHLPLN